MNFKPKSSNTKAQLQGVDASKPISQSDLLKKPKALSNLLVIVLVVVVVAGAITAGIAEYTHYHNDKIASHGVCSASSQLSLMRQASGAVGLSDTTKLAGVASQIKELPNYQKDANCMYVLTLYNVKVFNINQAQADLKLFNQDYNGHNLNPGLSYATSVTTLRSAVANMNQTLQQDAKNSNELSPRQPK